MNTVIKLNKILTLFLTFFIPFIGFAQNGPNCPTGICIGPGGSITSGSLTVASNAFYASITIKTGQTLTVKSGCTLYVGQVTNLATIQVVDFQNGCNVIIESGASLVVYGLLNNSNNSNGVVFNGSVVVTGNVTGGNGSTIVGAGTLDTTGTIITANTGSIFNSTGDCSTGPCSGAALNCTGSTNTISGNQTICSGSIPAILIGSNIDSGATYQWQYSTTFGANFIDIASAKSFSYYPSALNTTTYYRRIEVISGCTGTSSQVTVTVNNAVPTIATITAPTGLCPGVLLNPTAPTVTANGFAITAIGWQLESAVSSGTFSNLSMPYTVAYVDNGKKIRYYATNGCATTYSNQVTLTISPICVGGAVAGGTNVCSGTNSTVLTLNGQTGTIINWESSLDNFATAGSTIANTTTSLTASNLVATQSYRAILTSGGCSTSPSVSATVSVYTFPQRPTVGTITQPDCNTSTGSIVLTGLPTGGKVNPGNISYSGTSATISGLVPGNYTYTVTNASGCTSAATVSGSIVIISTANSFNGTSWSNGTPNSSQALVFNGNFSSTGDLSACSCQVASGNVVINSNHTLKVTNGITVTGGSLTFENNASLVQTNDAAVNSGNIIYKRTTPILANNYDFEYWGSPVVDQTLGTIWMASNWADTFYNFDSKTTNNWVRNYAADKMISGKGYISRARNGQFGLDYNNVSSIFNAGGTWTAKFYGVPNNGIVTLKNITSGNYCLIGNPYPSAIDVDAFMLKNNLVLGGTIYFWTHNTAIANNAYTSNDYASYNGVGGTATSKSISPGLNTSLPSGKIAAGQAFFATAIATNDVVFNNSMRVDNAGNSWNNTQFFKTSGNNKTASGIEKNRIWLNLTNDQGAFKQTLLGYVTGATNDFDESFDGESFDGNSFIDFYSINQNRNFTIQGRALPFDENDVVPLGFKTNISGTFKINIDQSDGLLANQTVYILDKLTGINADLKSGDYTFTTIMGTFNDRFVLRFLDKMLATDRFVSNENRVLVFTKNGQLKINSYLETLDKVLVYDLLGKLIYQKSNVNNNELSISNLGSNQTVLVKTSLQNGSVFTDKIIY